MAPSTHLEAPDPGPLARARGTRAFLGLLEDHERATLERFSRTASFAPGAVLMHEGLQAESVLVLLDGLVKVTCVTGAGREMILGICGSGELLGEVAAIDEEPHAATVVALGRVTAMVLSARIFREFVQGRPGAAVAVLRTLGDRFRDADRRLVEFGAGDALSRLASRLVELCARYGEPTDRGVTIALHLSQEELAGWAGCSMKAAVNSLHTLRAMGVLETGRRQITVLDLDALRARAAYSA